MLHIDNIISQMTDALGYIDMLSTSLPLLQVAIISGNFELAELIKKHRESDTGKNNPWSTKPVIRVNLVKSRCVHHLKAE